MLRNKEQRILLVLATLTAAPFAQSAETIFFQDFGCDGTAGTKSGGGVCTGGATTPQTWDLIANPDGQGGETYSDTRANGVTEIIRADGATSVRPSTPDNFSVTTRNWDIHDGSQNTQVSGYRSPNGTTNPNMQGNMLGHVIGNTNTLGIDAAFLPDTGEDNYYQINGIALSSALASAQLSFDFDSLILTSAGYDGDGFGVAISTDGGTDFNILTPTGTSAMQYRNLPTGSGDYSLDTLLGETYGAPLVGYDGSGIAKAGTALFDLSGFRGQTVSLRFAWASNNSNGSNTSSEGINIDNITVTGICTTGSGPNCNTPGNNAPEPASLGLALLGLTAAWRRRAKRA